MQRVHASIAARTVLVLLLGGCGSLLDLPAAAPPPALYQVTPWESDANARSGAHVEWTLLVEPPRARASLDTDRIAQRSLPTELKYFAGARWSDRTTIMLQGAIAQTFENSGRIPVVATEPIGVRPGYLLATELRDFAAVYYEGAAPVVRLEASARLIGQSPARLVGARNFEVSHRAQDGSMEAIVTAFDEAFHTFAQKLVAWTFESAAR